MRKLLWQRYCLLMQKKNGFVEFHHFKKKERLNNSSKTFLRQWKPMGFCKIKKCEEIFTKRLRYVNYLHSSSIHMRVRTKQRKGENLR